MVVVVTLPILIVFPYLSITQILSQKSRPLSSLYRTDGRSVGRVRIQAFFLVLTWYLNDGVFCPMWWTINRLLGTANRLEPSIPNELMYLKKEGFHRFRELSFQCLAWGTSWCGLESWRYLSVSSSIVTGWFESKTCSYYASLLFNEEKINILLTRINMPSQVKSSSPTIISEGKERSFWCNSNVTSKQEFWLLELCVSIEEKIRLFTGIWYS